MDTSKKITSYEDACKVLNIQPINEEVFNAFPKEDQRSMLAYHKLTVITRALNNGWKPNWNNTDQYKYYPYFYIQENAKGKGSAGLSCANANYAAANTAASIGSRLCFYASRLARYAGNQFTDLYEQILIEKL
jgi:hypothetical protein